MSELYRFIHAEKANCPIRLLCRVPHVARSSCYAWREGVAARRRRQAADDALAHEITVPHLASHRTYGVPSVHAELRRLGRPVNRKRVARVMRERDIRGVTRREHRSLTRPDKKAKPAPDPIGRDFTPIRPEPYWSATSPTCPPPRAGSTSPAGWTWPPARPSAARWPTTTAPNPSSTHSTWPAAAADCNPAA
ncbi:IS3 family transposase [Streptomyces sp. ITFR-6]|nr:IS3 family transposase [Streptomyces sp. ITFR-6]WNI30918.1 IS3 family transposase [Streptomyces sp. ITFR-6]